MTYGAVPEFVVDWHRALLSALRVEYFRPGLQELNYWREFLGVMSPLKEGTGGEFTKEDLAAVVALMRAQNRDRGGNWSLRFSKIMRDPESFRDLVLEARAKKNLRPRPPVRAGFRTVGDLTIATEVDPAAADPALIGESVAEQMKKFRRKMKGPASGL